MSAFSDYLTIIKNKRNLSSAEVANICGIDTTVIFRWMKGERIPEDISKLRKLELKLRLSEHEKNELEDAYVVTVLGKEKYRDFKDIIRIINELRRCRDESNMVKTQDEISSEDLNGIKNMCNSNKSDYGNLNDSENISNDGNINENGNRSDDDNINGNISNNRNFIKEFRYFSNKSSIINGIEQVLTKFTVLEGKKLYVINSSIDKEVNVMLRIYCNIMDCKTEYIACLQNEEIKLGTNINLRMILEAIEVVFRKNNINIYLTKQDVMGDINWILSDYFYIQYNSSMTEGFMTTYEEWINMQKQVFDYIKSGSSAIGKNEMEDLHNIENEYPENAIIKCIGHQPCFFNWMNENGYQAKEIKIFFSEQGLHEFIREGVMKNKNLCGDSSPVMSVKERCRRVRELAGLSEEGTSEYYMIRDSRLADLKIFLNAWRIKNMFTVRRKCYRLWRNMKGKLKLIK